MIELPLTGGADRLAEVAFTPTRAAGLVRLQAFVPRSGRAYAETRNYDFGPDDRSNVSALSPWIRHRLVTEEEVLAATLARFRPSTAEKFIQEVFWRAYFKGWLEQRPVVWSNYSADVAGLVERLGRDVDLLDRYSEAIEGRTGLASFDTWARELVATGYLHNHARMWFASIWIFTLELPWQLGADFFYRHLLDGDPASNTLSWRWVGGLHTKGKTYLARSSNIAKYTDGRFDGAGPLATAAHALDENHAAPKVPLRSAANERVQALDRPFGLLLSDEDAHPETLPLPSAPKAVFAMSCVRRRARGPTGEPAIAFSEGAVRDALIRSREHFQCSGEEGPFPADTPADEPAARVVDWARAQRVSAIVTAFAPVGPTHEFLNVLRPHCEANGIELLEVRRDYDTHAWPHATKGFFALKKKIPALLELGGLA